MTTRRTPAGARPDRSRHRRPGLRATLGRGLAASVAMLAGLLPAGVQAAGFTPVTQLDGVPVAFDAGPRVAAAPDGTAFAAWVRPGTPATALVAVRAPGGTWVTQDLGPTTFSAGGVPLGVAGDGTATVLVVDATGSALRALTRPPGGMFGSPRLLTPLPTNRVTTAALAVNRSGEAVAAWRDSTSGGATWTPKAAIRDAGGWNQSSAIGPTGPLSPSALSLDPLSAAINEAGRAAVGFGAELPGPVYRAFLALRPVGGEFPVNATPASTEGVGLHVRTAVTPAGRALASFREQLTVNGQTLSRVSWRVSEETTPELGPPTEVSLPGDVAVMPSVAAGPGEQFHGVWESKGTARVAYASRAATGGLLLRRYLSPVGATSVMPSISVDAAGNRLALWANFGDGTVQGSYRAAGDADFGDVLTVDTPGSGVPFGLAATPDGRGNHVLAWGRGETESTGRAQLAAFDAEAPTVSALATPPSLVATVRAPFSVTATDVWSTPSVAWSFGDGTAGSGTVVEHAYGAPGTPAVSVVATDDAGNRSGASTGVTVAPHPGVDADGDGHLASRDCNDADPAVHPGARDVPGNKLDENCDGFDAGYRTIDASATLVWKPGARNRLRFGKFDVVGVRTGDRVKLRCSGTGCKRSANVTRRVKRVRRNTLVLTDRVGKLSLGRGAKLTITFSRDDFSTKVITYAVKNGRSGPKKTVHCLVPGSKRATDCA